jgi:hypothetical protein
VYGDFHNAFTLVAELRVRITRLSDGDERKGDNVKWLVLVPFLAAVVIWNIVASLFLFVFPDRNPRDNLPPEFEAASDQHARRTMLFRLVVVVILGDHFKSGQPLSVQNRPTEVAVQD